MEKLYRSMDGQIFKTEKECQSHECQLSDWANEVLEQFCLYYRTLSSFVGYGYFDDTVFVIQITDQNFKTINKALKVLECNELDPNVINTIQLIGVTYDGECAFLMGTMGDFIKQILDRHNRNIEGRIK